MPLEVSIVVSPSLQRKLKALAALDKTAEMTAAKRRIGTLALQDQRGNFKESSDSPASAGWPPLSDVAVVLRTGGPKIFDAADIEAKRAGIKLLRDSNRLYASLTPQAPGNVFDVLPKAVQVGTNVSYARIHQRGGSSTFRFGEEEEKRFERNVSATKRGMRKPTAYKGGRRHTWKRAGKESPWNPLFFKMRGAFRKMKGKRYKVPARPFLVRPRADWARRYADVVRDAIRRIIA